LGRRTRPILSGVHHDRGNLSLDGSISGRSRQSPRSQAFPDVAAYHPAAHLPRHSGGVDLYFHHRAFGLRSAGDHRHVKQDFYFLDFHFLQDAAAGGVAKLRRRWSGEQPARRPGAVAELVVFQGAPLLFPLRRGHRTRLSSKTCRAWTPRSALRMDISWIFLSRRQTSAISSPRLGGAAQLFPAAVCGGIAPGVAAELLRAAVGSHVRRRAKHIALDVSGADPDVDSLPCDILGDPSIGPKVAGRVCCAGVFFPPPAPPFLFDRPRVFFALFFLWFFFAFLHLFFLFFFLYSYI